MLAFDNGYCQVNGTLLHHGARGDEINLLVLTTGEQGPHAARSRISEQEDAAAFLGANLFWGGFEDGAIPEGREGIMAVEAVMNRTGADIVYAPAQHDSHQDHRAAAIITLAATRRTSRVLCYESPTSIGGVRSRGARKPRPLRPPLSFPRCRRRRSPRRPRRGARRKPLHPP